MITPWCPTCTCGWYRPVDAFDVSPPEADCRNLQCDCHAGFWQLVDFDQLDELTKRSLNGSWTPSDDGSAA